MALCDYKAISVALLFRPAIWLALPEYKQWWSSKERTCIHSVKCLWSGHCADRGLQTEQPQGNKQSSHIWF